MASSLSRIAGAAMRERSPSGELDTLAVFVHGLTAFGHLLGVVYNFRKSRRVDRDVIIHAAALVYDVHSAIKHAVRRRGQ